LGDLEFKLTYAVLMMAGAQAVRSEKTVFSPPTSG
jgi:hypothetical protein